MSWLNIEDGENLGVVRGKLNALGAKAFSDTYESNATLLNTNADVYADGDAGIADPLTTTAGWYFKNTDDLTNKINWYYAQNVSASSIMNLGSLTNQWAIVDVRAEGSPFFTVYTAKENDGNDAGSWYRSSIVYKPQVDLTAYIGQTIMLYWGDEPSEDPLLPRVECTQVPLESDGLQIDSEVVSLAALATGTGHSAGHYEFVASEVGYTFAGVEHVYALTAFPTVVTTLAAQTVGYTDTHYIHLDAVNDYLSLTGSFDAPSSASDVTWAIGFEVESVSAVNDASYTTMFSSGDTAFTLRKGGSNWGIYCFANQWSMAQANTWYAPSAGSKILIQWDGTYIDYYLNGTRRAHMNANSYADSASPVAGLLEFGKGGVSTVHWSLGSWFGGINNLMISDELLGSDYIAEYFGSQDVSSHSYYDTIVDFLPLGEGTYPAVTGLKGNVTGTLENGTESDFVER